MPPHVKSALDYYARIGAALFPIPAGAKTPTGIVASFALDCSRDPAQWAKWAEENPGCNFGVVAGPSTIIIVDIDTKEGRDAAWQLWCELCASWGVAVFNPQVQSARGGWHVYFLVPEGVDARSLRQPDAIKGLINIRAGNGYVVTAGSYYDGTAKGEQNGHYSLLRNDAPYPAPEALVRHCSRADRQTKSAPVTGSLDAGGVAGLIKWLAERGAFEAYEDWVSVGMSLKLEFGDAGLEIWQLAHDDTVTDEVELTKWDSFSTEPTAGSVTLNSWMKRAHDMGWTGSIGKSVSAMFQGAQTPAVSPASIAPASSPSLVPEQQPIPLRTRLMQTSAEFVAAFKRPSYLWHGVLQRGYVYSTTAKTGEGKTAFAMTLAAYVALGRSLGDREVQCGDVLYFAAENDSDVRARWIAMAEHMNFDPTKIRVHFVTGASRLSEVAQRITDEVNALGRDFALVVADTSAALFEGEDENSNVHAIEHAKRMRSLTKLRGNPTVIVLCHPVKSGDNLLPRGGGSFIAEMDGNLCGRKTDNLVEVHWSGKFRGPDFAPMLFELRTVTAPLLKDDKGRSMPTVIAVPVDEARKQLVAAEGRRDEDRLLRAIEQHPDASMAHLATVLGWAYGRDGKPNKMRVKRTAEALKADKLIAERRGALILTAAGQKELNRQDASRPSQAQNLPVTPTPLRDLKKPSGN